MKKWIHSNEQFRSTRGHDSRVKGDKRKLRDIVDAIYDEVERRNLIDWFGNIKSAGKKYYIDWFRFNDGWMLADRASDFAEDVQKVIDDLGFSDKAGIQFIKNSVDTINKGRGGQCYIVRVVVSDPLVIDDSSQNIETTNLIH